MLWSFAIYSGRHTFSFCFSDLKLCDKLQRKLSRKRNAKHASYKSCWVRSTFRRTKSKSDSRNFARYSSKSHRQRRSLPDFRYVLSKGPGLWKFQQPFSLCPSHTVTWLAMRYTYRFSRIEMPSSIRRRWQPKLIYLRTHKNSLNNLLPILF